MRRVVMVLAFSLHACGGPSSAPHVLYKPGPTATVPIRITFDNRIGKLFEFERLTMLLDQQLVLTDGEQAAVRDHVRAGQTATVALMVTPGQHLVKSLIEFRGSGDTF